MRRVFAGMSLTLCLCLFSVADEIPAEPSVSVECCGRLRHGVVAVGGETTGTTISFNGVVWELQLPDKAAQDFANSHHKESIKVTGKLRKLDGTEVRDRWILDVDKVAEMNAAKDKEGARMTLKGTLRSRTPQKSDGLKLTIHSDNQIWPVDFSSDTMLQTKADSLTGQKVVLSGQLEKNTKEESPDPIFIKARTLTKAESP